MSVIKLLAELNGHQLVCHNKSPSVLGEIDKVLKSHNCPSTKGWHIPDF